MKLSIIIACYNSADLIGYQLEAIAQQSWSDPWEVIVADNGSTDGSRAVVAQYEGRVPNLRVVDASGRRGPAYARNIGVQAATGEALVFCDADDVVAPGWLAAMGTALSQHDFVACVTNTEQLNPESLQFHGTLQNQDPEKLKWHPYARICGASSMGVKRTLYQAVGGFDENFQYLSDADFCCKVHLYGVTLQSVSAATVHYRLRTTYSGLYRQARNWAQMSVLLFKRYRVRRNRGLWRWGPYWRQGKWLLKEVPKRIGTAKGRAFLVWQLGWQIGLLRGSIKYRIPPPAPE